MTTIRLNIISLIAALSLGAMTAKADAATDAATPESNRYERNLIVEGNKLYRQQRYAEAETRYRKALEINPVSPQARYNLAASLIRQSGSADPNAERNPMGEAQRMLSDLSALRSDMTEAEREIAELADYNLGNIAFNNNDFGGAIEAYKKALRLNPDNDKARQNLRLAQLKQQEQQQNQDQNQDNQNQDQNQDNKQDQNNQDQQQNQDQNNSNDRQQDQQQNKDQQQGQDKNQPKQQPERQRSGMSDANAEQILKAMENEEAATRRRVEAERRKSEAAKRRHVTNPW